MAYTFLDNPVAEIMDLVVNLSKHPSLKISGISDNSTSDISSSTNALTNSVSASVIGAKNTKLFVIGLIPPDYPVSYIPIKALPKDVKTVTPVEVTQKTQRDKTQTANVNAVSQKVQMSDVRALMSKYFAQNLNGRQPSDELLNLMFAQCCLETGAANKNSSTIKDVQGMTNYNIASMHSGQGSSTDGYVKGQGFPANVQGTPVTPTFYAIPDSKGNITFTGSDGNPYTINAKSGYSSQNISVPMLPYKDGVLAVDPTNPANSAMIKSLYSGPTNYLGLDTEAGTPYLGPFYSYNSLDEGVAAYMSYLLNSFPGILTATNGQSFDDAIQNGVPPPKKFHDPTVNDDYIKALDNISNLASKKFQPSGNDEGSTGIIAFGASTDSSDPLGPVYGRNIIANESRMQIVNEQKAYLNNQINIMHSIPPLIMLVNPSDFKRNYENLVDFSTKVRAGNVVHTWLERPMKISCSGVSAAQYAVYADGSGGLSNYDRIQTISYMNLMSLAMIYKNNGMIFGDSGLTDEGVMILPGSVFIYYDDMLYLGSFDDFSITDNAEKPYNLEYSFNFTTRFTTEFTV